MTLNTDLQAARSRVAEQQRQLEQARSTLAIAEHQAYSDALQLIADELSSIDANTTAGQVDAGMVIDAISNIRLVLEGVGVEPSAKAVRR